MPTVDIDREAAREAAERELNKPIYPRPSPKQQFIDFLETLVQRLILKGSELPGGWFTIGLLLILLAAAVVAAVHVSHRMLGDRHRDRALFGVTQLSAAEHRATAQRHAASGDWLAAIRHRLRAVARELEETGLLHPAPGRTATELARAAGALLPDLTGELIRAAETFNDVSYGQVPATAGGYRIVTELDDRVRATTQARQYR